MYEYVKYKKVKSITEKAQRRITNNNYFLKPFKQCQFKKLQKEEVSMIVCEMWYFSIILLRTKCLYPASYQNLMMGPDVSPFNNLRCSFIYSRVRFGDKMKFS